jgi:hypothetical protein
VQVAVFLAAYVIYEIARWLTTGSSMDAVGNAARVFNFEAGLGLDVEAKVQETMLGFPLMAVLN